MFILRLTGFDPVRTSIFPLRLIPSGGPIALGCRATVSNPEAPMIESHLAIPRRLALRGLVAASLLFALGTTGFAQQTTGTPGSPSATTTIDGKYLPNPPPKFGGTIGLDAAQSKPYWPPNVVPPQGAPNVLLIMTDDAGYGVSGTFGGVIPTPALDRIARLGLR